VRRLLGIGFILVALMGVATSVLIYRKAFTPAVMVTLQADHTGLQLNLGADVKFRGVVVGEVRRISADGEQASLQLALDPVTVRSIPANVTARLLPRTLFGEKYVELVSPADAAGATPIAAGAVITLDRSETAVELQHVLDRLLPVLQAIRPDALAATLGAFANALEDRGQRLGSDIDTADQVLAQLNDQLPAIQTDVRLLAGVLDTYAGSANDLVTILRNLTTTMQTVSEQRTQLADFLVDLTEFGDDTSDFLDRHGDRIIQLGQVTRPVLDLLAEYAPEYPCLLKGAVALQPAAESAFASGQMHITLEITKDQGKYAAGRDEPAYAAHNGPSCQGLPSPNVPFPAVNVNDGYQGRGGSSAALNYDSMSMGDAGTAQESQVIDPIVAAATGTRVDQVPDIAVLLWGPLLRGTVVNLR
jgi:phospholipid/cholesterol/gamma-HCH transport system substrate-binding protein